MNLTDVLKNQVIYRASPGTESYVREDSMLRGGVGRQVWIVCLSREVGGEWFHIHEPVFVEDVDGEPGLIELAREFVPYLERQLMDFIENQTASGPARGLL